MAKIKLIAIDLDETLLDTNKNISNANKEAIKRAKDLGIKIVISSGRSEMGIRPVLEELDLLYSDTYYIAYNGTRIYHLPDNKLIYETYLTGKDIKDIFQTLPNNLYTHFYDSNKNLYANKRNPYTDFGAKINHIDYQIVNINELNDNDHFIKLLFTGDKKDVDAYASSVSQSIKNRFSLTRSNPIYFEFLAKNTSKGSALHFLKKYLNYSDSNIMAMGDNDNDLEMLQEAGIKIAMENSLSQRVLDIATFITKSNDNDGVAYAIDIFVK